MTKIFSLLQYCPVCAADLYGGAQTSMGYWSKDFECNAEFVLYDDGRVEVSRPCPQPSNLAANDLHSTLPALQTKTEPAVELDDDVDTCIACDMTFKHGDMVFYEIGNGGYIHAACCGPERDGYVGEDGEPLKEGDPIPEPFSYESDLSFRSSINQNGDAV